MPTDLQGQRLANPLEWSEALQEFDERQAHLQQVALEPHADYRYNVAGHTVDSVDDALKIARSIIYVGPKKVAEYEAALLAGRAVTVRNMASSELM